MSVVTYSQRCGHSQWCSDCRTLMDAAARLLLAEANLVDLETIAAGVTR